MEKNMVIEDSINYNKLIDMMIKFDIVSIYKIPLKEPEKTVELAFLLRDKTQDYGLNLYLNIRAVIPKAWDITIINQMPLFMTIDIINQSSVVVCTDNKYRIEFENNIKERYSNFKVISGGISKELMSIITN